MWLTRRFYALSWVAAIVFEAAANPLTTSPRRFEWTLSWEEYAPDGFSRELILINGKFPGPKVELNEGDDVEILVHNKMPFNTTVHFHGIEMLHTPWSDGVPGLTQRQIQARGSFTYKWKATQAGAYWYHAHERGQLDDGLYGPIVIHPMGGVEKPFGKISSDAGTLKAIEKAEANVQPILFSDFRHVSWVEGWNLQVASGIETPCYDSFLINGKGSVDCMPSEKITSLLRPSQQGILQLVNGTGFTAKGCLPAADLATILAPGLPTNLSAIPPGIFDVCTPSKGDVEVIDVKAADAGETWAAFDLIATFGLHTAVLSIDETPMYVYAVDGSYIEPQLVDAIVATNGDRYSVLVKLDNPGDYSVRVASLIDVQVLAGSATLRYRVGDTPPPTHVSQPFINEAGVNTSAEVRFFNQAGMKSFPPDHISQTADQTIKLAIRVSGQSYQWALNDTSYPQALDDATPLLFVPPSLDLHNNVTISTKNGTWVDIILEDTTFPMPPHPIHKHGNKMWMIGAGEGRFNYSSVAQAMQEIPQNFNLVDPPKRDSLATLPAVTGPVWMAVRYHVNNPGAWLLHCHIQSHLLGGMSMAIQDGVDHWPTVPNEYLNYY